MLADDSPLFRRGLISLLNSRQDIEVVGEASDGLEALEKAREIMPDVILMDINMPGMNGLEATRLIKEEMPYIKIVMLTVSEDEQHLFEAIKLGAGGYLLKNLEPEELFDMVLGIARGEAPISPPMATKILSEFASQYQAPPRAAARSRLSEREKEVLQLVVRGDTNREIAQHLSISESTVKSHLQNIMEKLHVQNRVQAAIRALHEEEISLPEERS
jgi:DNA-binding NarL/FixJ family response regulator